MLGTTPVKTRMLRFCPMAVITAGSGACRSGGDSAASESRSGPVQAGGRRCLPAGTLRPDVQGAALRGDPETALVGWSAPEAAAPEDPDVEIFTRERSHADIPSASSGDSHAELGSRFRQAIQPTTIDSVAPISGGTPCPYSPWRVTVASAANITVQPSAEPTGRLVRPFGDAMDCELAYYLIQS
jgi:hypothetical protein